MHVFPPWSPAPMCDCVHLSKCEELLYYATMTSFTNPHLVSHLPTAHDPLSWCIESLFLLVVGYIK